MSPPRAVSGLKRGGVEGGGSAQGIRAKIVLLLPYSTFERRGTIPSPLTAAPALVCPVRRFVQGNITFDTGNHPNWGGVLSRKELRLRRDLGHTEPVLNVIMGLRYVQRFFIDFTIDLGTRVIREYIIKFH